MLTLCDETTSSLLYTIIGAYLGRFCISNSMCPIKSGFNGRPKCERICTSSMVLDTDVDGLGKQGTGLGGEEGDMGT